MSRQSIQPSAHSNGFTNYQAQGPLPAYLQPQNHPAYVNAVSGAVSTPLGALQGKIYQVQFKLSVRYFTLSSPATLSQLQCGDFVVVEADRGEDIGVITDVLTMKAFVDRRITNNLIVDDNENSVGKILRPASLSERQLLPEKFRNEENVLQVNNCNDVLILVIYF
jgi:hypothetical protein